MPSSGDAILPPPKAVLFDVDGTLVDTMELILQTLGETYRRHLGVEIPAEDIRGIIGRPLEVQVRWFDDRATRKPDHEAMIRFQIVAYEAGKQLEHPIPEALETVRVCARKGIRTALVTSKEQNEFSHTLPRLELNGSLNATVNSSEVSHPKPAPDTALLACERIGIGPTDSLFVGDTDYDVQCGKAAGCKTAAVLWGAQTRDRVAASEPDLIFRTPADLLAWSETL